ncbi:hypothetical protein [Nonomuraea recticatena]
MRLRHLAALVASLLMLALVQTPSADAAGTRPVAITITKVRCVDDCRNEGLEAAGESAADFFAEVWIDGVDLPRTPRAPDDQELVEPFWPKGHDVPDTRAQVPISVQIWDWDTTSGHDNGDASPRNNDNNLDITVDLATGRWTGDVNWPQSCAIGDGNQDDDEDEPRVEVCFDVSTDTTSGDADGDGLLDGWERNGYNDNADSTIDVDLPRMGADPRHKDLFVEMDWVGNRVPTRESVAEIRAAFAAAPENAGGVTNPDGKRGITFHLDMGGLPDINLREAGMPQGTCNDGVDNGGGDAIDGADVTDCFYRSGSVEDPPPGDCGDNTDNDNDGRPDALDPDCLVADDFGALARGNPLTGQGTTQVCGLNQAFFDIKNQFFDQARRFIFHYGISVAGAAGCTKGGQGRIGGGVFVDHNNSGRTVFHELGHNLDLHHGGVDENRCKPNHVSLMNYDHRPGVPRQGGGVILDFSPPRIALDGSDRGRAPLAPITENMLNENTIVDPRDTENRFIFVDATGAKAPHDLDANPDWNGDGDDPPFENPVIANVDTVGANGRPPACRNTSTTDTLQGADDWSRIKLRFNQSGGDADLDPEPLEEEIEQLWEQLNTADLSVAVSDSPDPVAAGTETVYTVTVRNAGPAPATSVRALVSLPVGFRYVGSNARCTTSGCYLGEIPAHGERRFTVTAAVAEDLVHRNGGPKTVATSVEVANLAGPDPSPAGNKAQEDTRVVAVADLAMTGFTATAPDQLLVGQSAEVPLKVKVANNGPSTPMDAVVSFTGGVADLPVLALAKGSPRELAATVRFSCDKPGNQRVALAASVAPASAADTDPEPGNNGGEASFTVDCVIPVAINIKPGSNPNSINPKEANVPLAVLTTKAGEYGLPIAFDATSIQPLSVRFGPRDAAWTGQATGSEVHRRGHVEDSLERGNPETVRDGDADMVLHFGSGESGLTPGLAEACVKGTVTGAGAAVYRFFGCDATRVH